MNQNINIDIELSLPSDIITILNNINTQLGTITRTANTTTSAFDKLGSIAENFNSIDTAIRTLNGPMRTLGILLATKVPFINKIVNGFQLAAVQVALFKMQTAGAAITTATLTANLTAKQIVAGMLTKQIGFLIGAKVLWKKALFALSGPVGWIIAGVGLLVAGVIGLVSWLNRGTEAGAAFASENERSAKAMDDLNSSIDSNRRAHDNNVRSAQVSNRVNNDLIDSLDSLRNAENLTAGQRAQVRNTVEQLNSSMEGLNLVIDEETGLLTESSRALLEQARLYNDVNSARSQADSILNRLNQAQAEAIEKQLELDILAARRASIEEDDNLRWGERRKLIRELDNLEQETIGTKEQLTNEIEILGNMHYEVYTQMSDTTVQFVEDQKFAYENLSDSQRAVVDKLVDRWTTYRDLSREMFSEVRTETKLWSETTDEEGNVVRQSLLEVGDTQENVMQAMIDNMRANREATTQWSDNLDELASRTSEEFAEHMRSMGIGSAGYVAAMLSDCHELLYELAAEFEMGGHAATDNIASSLGDGGEELVGLVDELGRNLGTTLSQSIVDADFESIGMALPKGLTRGIEDGMGESVEAVSNMSKGMSEAFEKLNDINSPSGLYRGFGENIIEGLCEGINQIKSQATTTLEAVSNKMKRIYQNANSDYANIGRNIMSGLNQGLLSGEGGVMATANRIANNIAATMRRALQINSPSRLMREQVGRQIPAGVADGIDKYSGYALDSVSDLGKDLLKVNLPKMSDIIKFGPSLSYAGAGGAYAGNVTNVDRTNDNRGLFDGATINWHGKQDIRETMEEIAWEIQSQDARFI